MPEKTSEEKKGMRINKGILTAIPCLIFSVLCLVASRTYPNLTASYMLVSASFFPTIVSVLAIIMSLIMLIEAIVKPDVRDPLTAQEKKGYLRGLLTILDCLAYLLLFKPLGYILSSILAYFALMVIFGNRRWVLMVIMSIVLPVALYLAFYYLLQTNLPMGVLQYVVDLF
ncbi:MAG: tripartite tricarboxylate transporter TctB family protein [Clostridiales bacterium]|nr:tripartite tricarboxylate transporter TctB family protein [Clostridiales bacterium]